MTKEQKMVAQAIIQVLTVTPHVHPETLRRRIGEMFADAPGTVPKAAKMTPFQWRSFLIEVDLLLAECGLSLLRGSESVSIQTQPVKITKVRNYLDEVAPVRTETDHSQAALEVIVMCAYKNGCTAAEVEQISGVNRFEVIRRLHAEGSLYHRRSIPGQGAVWEVTEQVLQKYKVNSVQEFVDFMNAMLPQVEEMQQGRRTKLSLPEHRVTEAAPSPAAPQEKPSTMGTNSKTEECSKELPLFTNA